MIVNLLRITKSESEKEKLYCDFHILGVGIIKGCIADMSKSKKLQLQLPFKIIEKRQLKKLRQYNPNHTGMYNPFCFESEQRHEEFVRKALDAIAIKIFGEPCNS
jgi:hypothetical protein